MSRVLLLAADKPLPFCDRRCERTKTVTVQGEVFSVTTHTGFLAEEHLYYREAVDALGHAMKPHQVQIDLENCEEDLHRLRDYLRTHFAAGEEAELWNLWVGSDDLGPIPHYRGRLADFDEETLQQFLFPPHKDGGLGQCRMTVTI